MSETITKRNEIPDAPYYVLANDSFMSGWGGARDAINTVVLPCHDREEANAVAQYAESRPEQKRVRIVLHKPRLRPNVVYSLLTRNNAPRWYPKHGE